MRLEARPGGLWVDKPMLLPTDLRAELAAHQAAVLALLAGEVPPNRAGAGAARPDAARRAPGLVRGCGAAGAYNSAERHHARTLGYPGREL